MYPPTRTLASASHTISGESYGNGLYKTWESTKLNRYYPGFLAFNESSLDTDYGYGYQGASNQYKIGDYIGNNYIVSDYKGDWLKIELPNPIKLTKYRILSRQINWKRAPGYYRIYGSNDNTNWTLLHDKNSFESYTYSNYYNNIYYFEENVVSNEYYKYFALVVNKLSGDSRYLYTTVNIKAWFIYGKE